jgi:hypothetical protein
MPGCTFQDGWLAVPHLKDWVAHVPGNAHAVLCLLCNKQIDITTMGKTALTSHASGSKHRQKAVKQTNESMLHYLTSATVSTSTLPANSQGLASTSQGAAGTSLTSSSRPDTSALPSSSSVGSVHSRNNTITVDQFVTKSVQLKAEAILALKTVASNFSFHSNQDISSVFSKMFPDSNIAQSVTISETKSMYLACFGIAPYLTRLLESKVQGTDFVLMFDESLNKELQKKQMIFFPEVLAW